MAFSIYARNIPKLLDYKAALDHYTRAKPFKNHYITDARPLDAPRKHHMAMYRRRDGSLACRLHSTDVVVYHDNGDITLHPYASISTDLFANALLPYSIRTGFNSGLTTIDKRIYHLKNTDVRLRATPRGWEVPDDGYWLFRLAKLDRKATNAALKQYKFDDYRAWVEMYARLRKTPDNWSYPIQSHIAANILAGVPDTWLFTIYGTLHSVDVAKTLTEAKLAIIRTEKTFTVQDMPYCDTYAQARACAYSAKYL